MNIDFTKNETIKRVGKSNGGQVDDKAISDLLEAIKETTLFDVREACIPNDVVMLLVYGFLAGRLSGIREERQRRRRK